MKNLAIQNGEGGQLPVFGIITLPFKVWNVPARI
jgi:hypothetical protein